MELLLVRHALPVRREVVDGPADPELSEAGRRQAQHLAEYLSTERVHAVYSSPLRRARETAAPVAAAQGVPVLVEDGIAEWDRNASAYVPVEELKATNDPRWQALVAGTWTVDGLSPDEFRRTVVTALDAIATRHPAQKVAVVCHGGVINTYLAHVLDLPNTMGFFYPNYTSIHRVAVARSGERSIVTVNETSHLRGTGLPMGLFQHGDTT
jgi:probable phosphoglycerate mutase